MDERRADLGSAAAPARTARPRAGSVTSAVAVGVLLEQRRRHRAEPVLGDPARAAASKNVVVAERRAAARAGSGRPACRAGRRTSGPDPGRRPPGPGPARPAAGGAAARARRPTRRRCARTTATRRSRRSPRAARCPATARGSGCCRTTGGRARGRPAARARARPSTWLAPKTETPCASRGISSVVVGHDDGVAVERVGPEQLARRPRPSRGCRAKSSAAARPQPVRHDECCGTRRRPSSSTRTGRSAPSPGRSPSAGPARRPRSCGWPRPPVDQPAVGHHDVRRLGGDAEPVRRLVVRPVVAREPRRRTARLPGHDDAVGQLLPADLAPGAAQRAGLAGVPDRRRSSRCAGRGRLGQLDRELAAAGGVLAPAGGRRR